jgi:hypothetical protein
MSRPAATSLLDPTNDYHLACRQTRQGHHNYQVVDLGFVHNYPVGPECAHKADCRGELVVDLLVPHQVVNYRTIRRRGCRKRDGHDPVWEDFQVKVPDLQSLVLEVEDHSRKLMVAEDMKAEEGTQVERRTEHH